MSFHPLLGDRVGWCRSAALSLAALAVATLWVVPAAAQSPAAEPPPVVIPDGIGEVTLFGEEEITVEAATKTELPVSKAPGSVAVIAAKQIRESGAQTLPDLLRLVAGVNVRWNPMVQTIDVRGFGENPFSNRMLVMIDGVPFNSGDTGGVPLSPSLDVFPLQAVKRIEILRGPGSALYGENAFWGVINIVTLSGDDLRGGSFTLAAGDRHTARGGLLWGDRVGETSLLFAARRLRSQFPTELWLENDSRYEADDILVKAKWKGLQLSYYRHDDELGGFREEFGPQDGFPPGTSFSSAENLEQTYDLATVKLDLGEAEAPVTFHADFAYSRRDGMHCAGCHAMAQAPEYALPADHGYQAIADVRVGLHMVPSHEILIGVEGRQIEPGDHQDELDHAAEAVQGYEKLAAYIQDQISIGDRLTVIAGLRYDQETELFDAETSPRLSVVWNPESRFVVRGSWSRAFRFPSFSELFQNSWFLGVTNDFDLIPPIPLVVFAPNHHLVPEEIDTFELGGEAQLTPEVSARLDLFRSNLDNFMVLAFNLAPPAGPPNVQVVNSPETATITGGELELRANFGPTVTGFASYGHEKPSRDGDRRDVSGQPLELVYAPTHKAAFGAYLGPWSGFRAALEVSWRDQTVAPAVWYLVRSGFTDPTVRPLDAVTRVGAKLSYELPLGQSRRALRFSLIGENLLDERPEESLLGVPLAVAGRELFGEVTLSF